MVTAWNGTCVATFTGGRYGQQKNVIIKILVDEIRTLPFPLA